MSEPKNTFRVSAEFKDPKFELPEATGKFAFINLYLFDQSDGGCFLSETCRFKDGKFVRLKDPDLWDFQLLSDGSYADSDGIKILGWAYADAWEVEK